MAFGSDVYQLLLAIRYEVLRKPLGMEMQPKDTATDSQDYHLALLDGEKPIGCLLLRPLSETEVELRQLSILEGYRGRHLGEKLVRYAEIFAKESRFHKMQMRARRNVQGFYDKLGYENRETEFADEHTLRMVKML